MMPFICGEVIKKTLQSNQPTFSKCPELDAKYWIPGYNEFAFCRFPKDSERIYLHRILNVTSLYRTPVQSPFKLYIYFILFIDAIYRYRLAAIKESGGERLQPQCGGISLFSQITIQSLNIPLLFFFFLQPSEWRGCLMLSLSLFL